MDSEGSSSPSSCGVPPPNHSQRGFLGVGGLVGQLGWPRANPPPPLGSVWLECLITVTVAGRTDSKLYAGDYGADQFTHLPLVS